MSELKPGVYEFKPDLRRVFEDAPLPIRQFQIPTVLRDSLFMRGDSLPASLGGSDENESIEAVVRRFEEGDEPVDVKDARLIGLIAAMTEEGLESTTLSEWCLTPHLGMLNAIGAALAAGLMVSEDSLRMAITFHQEYSGHESTTSVNPYASPSADSAVLAIKHTILNYAGMDKEDEKGIEKYISYYTYDIDKTLYDLPLTADMLGLYENDEDAGSMVDLFERILTEVKETRKAVLDREDELQEYLEQVYEQIAKVRFAYDARIEGRGVQEELPGLEDLEGFSYARETSN